MKIINIRSHPITAMQPISAFSMPLSVAFSSLNLAFQPTNVCGLCVLVNYKFLRNQLYSVAKDLGIEVFFWSKNDSTLFVFTNSFQKFESFFEYIFFMQPSDGPRDKLWEVLGEEDTAEGWMLDVRGIYLNENWFEIGFYDDLYSSFFTSSWMKLNRVTPHLAVFVTSRFLIISRLLPLLYFLCVVRVFPALLLTLILSGRCIEDDNFVFGY